MASESERGTGGSDIKATGPLSVTLTLALSCQEKLLKHWD
jgi:hypothetical protein